MCCNMLSWPILIILWGDVVLRLAVLGKERQCRGVCTHSSRKRTKKLMDYGILSRYGLYPIGGAIKIFIEHHHA